MDESLIGYLIRLAELHGLECHSQILSLIKGKRYKLPNTSDILMLSELVGCQPNLIEQLFGFERRDNFNQRIWKIQNEWITKPYFISSRHLKHCPACLKERKYLRNVWELSLYQSCPYHFTPLITECPSCNKPITWTRKRLEYCNCGDSLISMPEVIRHDNQIHLSAIIENRLGNMVKIPSNVIPQNISDRLLNLSLDALFKTIWLFGEVIPSSTNHHHFTSTHKTSPKKIKLTPSVIDTAYEYLSDWPNKLLDSLSSHYKNNLTGTSSYIRKIYGPIHRYLEEDIISNELTFIKHAYEYQIRKFWAQSNKRAPRSLGNQLELPLED
ncbi:MAG: TniQ family protein [Flavobacteriaceae bacterium]|nr:TniQ family protein [Flavobacteriaceae bacterium]